ncbi:MAG: hypothetical protein QG614_226 [Patescibacteria group bacterium]|nr:hypothetical protein [Patescibacteria group bacterium]
MLHIKFKNKTIKGMSLMESIVTIAIIALLSTIMYSSYPQASSILGFNLTSQEIISIIKNTQMYGSSQGGNYKGRGIFVQTETGFNNTITEFLDIVTDQSNNMGVKVSNKYYDEDRDAILAKNIIKNSITINKICAYDTSNQTCLPSTKLSVTYIRPNTEAYIYYNFPDLPLTTTSHASIEIKSNILKQDNLKCIDIYESGQINISNKGC